MEYLEAMRRLNLILCDVIKINQFPDPLQQSRDIEVIIHSVLKNRIYPVMYTCLMSESNTLRIKESLCAVGKIRGCPVLFFSVNR